MGNYYETFTPSVILDREGPPLPDYQRAYALGENVAKVDEQVEAAVERRLGTLAGVIDLTRISVEVVNGFATLRGTVASERLRRALVNFADNTVGVRGVRDVLDVVP